MATRLNPRRSFLGRMLALSGMALPATGQTSAAPERPGYDVRRFGAVGDGSHFDTAAIQRAIDGCSVSGGGTVWCPPGRYLTGTIYLKSGVTLHLERGAVLLGSTNLADYPVAIPKFRSYTDNYTEKSLIYAEGVSNIGIAGNGAIDGQGAAFKGPYKVRPYLIRMVECRGVSVKDVLLKDSAMWVQHYLACEDVLIDGITVRSRCNLNNDGIDIDSCDRVRISNCDISSGDDAIVLKSTSGRKCRNVVVTNCIVSSYCNGLKLGTESNGGFEDITISNCTVYDTRPSGIALEMVDGGTLDRVNVSNITMRNVGCPIFIRLGNRARPYAESMEKPGMGTLRNVMISNVQADGADRTGCSITGLPGHPVENCTLRDIRITFKGGGTAEDARRQIPESPEKYPEYSMFGALPAYGFYCRHAKGLTFSNVEVSYTGAEQRPAMVCEDVAGLDLLNLRSVRPPEAAPVLVLRQASDALIQGCRSAAGTDTFLVIEGNTGRIDLIGNDFTDARKPFSAGSQVQRERIFVAANRMP